LTWRDDAGLSSAGSIADVGSHAYDTIRWILGCEATRVLAHGDVVSPAKPDLGRVNLQEALDWGGTHDATAAGSKQKGTAFDFASMAFELENGAVATMVVSHAFFLRKGLAPELELHGVDASLAIDRVHNRVTLMHAHGTEEIVHDQPADASVNRFARSVFPAMSAMLRGEPTDHPDLEDGYRVQLFTDAAAKSARDGAWVRLSQIDPAKSTVSG
jgi:predicted dehydrogenase